MMDYRALYDRTRRETIESARAAAPVIYRSLQPRALVDVGCGEGWWLEEFGKCGVRHLVGVDETENAPRAGIVFIQHDLAQPLTGLGQSDLALSLEVAEHLRPECAEAFVDTLCRLSEQILFSAAIPGQGGVNHINEQWPSYWIAKFAMRGYQASDLFRWQLWNDARVQPFYAQNLIYFAKSNPWANVVSDVVHPRLWVHHKGLQ